MFGRDFGPACRCLAVIEAADRECRRNVALDRDLPIVALDLLERNAGPEDEARRIVGVISDIGVFLGGRERLVTLETVEGQVFLAGIVEEIEIAEEEACSDLATSRWMMAKDPASSASLMLSIRGSAGPWPRRCMGLDEATKGVLRGIDVLQGGVVGNHTGSLSVIASACGNQRFLQLGVEQDCDGSIVPFRVDLVAQLFHDALVRAV